MNVIFEFTYTYIFHTYTCAIHIYSMHCGSFLLNLSQESTKNKQTNKRTNE